MRLAVFTNQFPGRTVTFFARDMRALIEAGASVDIFPFYPPNPALWASVPDLLNERILPRERVHHLSLGAALAPPAPGWWRRLPRFLSDVAAVEAGSLRHGFEPVAKGAYVALKAWAWAQRHAAGSYDHVLAYWGNHAATAAYLFHRLTDATIPFSMIVHARMDLYRKPAYLAPKLLYADNLFLVCEYNRRYIADRYPKLFPRLAPKIHIHHLGLDLDAVRRDATPRPPARLVGVGRLEPLKGFDHLLRAADLLRRRGIDVTVDLVGGGEDEPRLRRLTGELGLEQAVTFRGWLPPDAVLDAMRGASILVHPSVAPDAMPTVLKEAIAVGTPVVASRLAGIPEILDEGRCGVLVPPGDAGAIAAAVERLLTDAPVRARYVAAGRAHAERTFDLWVNGRRLAERLRATPRRAD